MLEMRSLLLCFPSLVCTIARRLPGVWCLNSTTLHGLSFENDDHTESNLGCLNCHRLPLSSI